MNRILVAAERTDSAKALAVRLGLFGYETTPASCELALALRSVYTFRPDAVVLESNDARICVELLRVLPKVCVLPIVVLGNERSEAAHVRFLEEGAAVYLGQPVSTALLAAHLRSVLRWAPRPAPGGRLRAGGLEIDLDRHEVRNNGRLVSLTPTEFRLLCVLAENKDRACSPRLLLERVWGPDFLDCRHYLRLYVAYLRQKLEDDPQRPQLLVTEWGVGYRLVDGATDQRTMALRPAASAAS